MQVEGNTTAKEYRKIATRTSRKIIHHPSVFRRAVKRVKTYYSGLELLINIWEGKYAIIKY